MRCKYIRPTGERDKAIAVTADLPSQVFLIYSCLSTPVVNLVTKNMNVHNFPLQALIFKMFAYLWKNIKTKAIIYCKLADLCWWFLLTTDLID